MLLNRLTSRMIGVTILQPFSLIVGARRDHIASALTEVLVTVQESVLASRKWGRTLDGDLGGFDRMCHPINLGVLVNIAVASPNRASEGSKPKDNGAKAMRVSGRVEELEDWNPVDGYRTRFSTVHGQLVRKPEAAGR
jgi:hypothetical protein